MKKNELVYPVYLDVPMMTSFLASMQGGIIEESEIHNKNKNSDTLKNKVSGEFGLSKIISFFKASISGEHTNEVENKFEANYKTNVKYPQSLLFTELKSILDGYGLISRIDSPSKIVDTSVGDIVEFVGYVNPEPAYSIRNAFNKLLPIIEPMMAYQILQLRQVVALAKSANKKNPFSISETEIIDDTNKVQYQKNCELKIMELENNQSLIKTMKDTVDSIFPLQTRMQRIVANYSEIPILCNVYPEYSRNSSMEEIYFCEWKIVGKVTSIISKNRPFDLLKDSPLSLLQSSHFSELIKSFNNAELSLPIVHNIIEDNSLVVAPIAIYC